MIPPGSDGTRTLFTWEVQLIDEHRTEQPPYRFSTYWSPETSHDVIRDAAVAQARCERRMTLHPLDEPVLVEVGGEPVELA